MASMSATEWGNVYSYNDGGVLYIINLIWTSILRIRIFVIINLELVIWLETLIILIQILVDIFISNLN